MAESRLCQLSISFPVKFVTKSSTGTVQFQWFAVDVDTCFTAQPFNNDFAYEISQEFVIPCITHQTATEERTDLLDRFRTGEYSMLVTSQVLNEGIDVPAANVGIILSGSASKRQYAQRLGRIPRSTEDRQPARLYEIIAANTKETYVSQRRRQGGRTDADS